MGIETNVGRSLEVLKEHVKSQASIQLGTSAAEFADRGISRDNLSWIISLVHGSIEKSFSTGSTAVIKSATD